MILNTVAFLRDQRVIHKDFIQKLKSFLVNNPSVMICQSAIDRILEQVPSKILKFNVAEHELKGEAVLYACIIYSVTHNILAKEFTDPEKDTRPLKDFINQLHYYMKCFYNSRNINEEQKRMVKSDSKIKYLLAEILRKKLVWRNTEEGMKVSRDKLTELQDLFERLPPKVIVKQLIKDINELTRGYNP